MGNAGSRGYSIRDAEREQHLKGSLHIVGRVPAQLVAQHQKNALETRQQQILLEHQNQATHHQMQGAIFQCLGRIEAGVENLNHLAHGGSSSTGNSSRMAKVQSGAAGDPAPLTAENVKAVAEQAAVADGATAKSKTSANRVYPEAVQVPAVSVNAGELHRRAFSPPTHSSRALGMHGGPPSRATRARARTVRTRLGWYQG
ncbi:hypothetical protein AC578_2143 [Pseudocercospora eumusae]|uniref:Uncharacterized protein n=1 Tax=Pseudocercospora eumusae TaxID=321146 RepID=A0A139HHK6_9PEZI|nr:hypothetical protein AC578_2143 [Pseudocercospora eumusae]